MKTVSIHNRSKAAAIASSVAVADTSLTRFLGLMGKRSLADDGGLWIKPSSGVHTCWMFMAIDVVALDRKMRVVRLGHRVRPWRISGLSLKTSSVLELPPGKIEACGIQVGDQLEIQHGSAEPAPTS